MTQIKLKIIITISIFLNIQATNAQEVLIKYIGNCAYKITFDSISIYSDFPYKSGAYGYMEYNIDSIKLDKNKKSYALFTHKHPDHYNNQLLYKTNLIPIYPRMSKRKNKEIFEEIYLNYGIKITPLKTKHKWSLNHNSYIIEWKGKLIYFFGDTHDFPSILLEKDIDLLFITTWAIKDINQYKLNLNIKNLVLYHLGPKETGLKNHLSLFLDNNLKYLKKKPEYYILKQYQEKKIKLF